MPNWILQVLEQRTIISQREADSKERAPSSSFLFKEQWWPLSATSQTCDDELFENVWKIALSIILSADFEVEGDKKLLKTPY